MAEIFLNALVIAYAIYHTAVVFGWALMLFDIANQEGEQTGCPESPGSFIWRLFQIKIKIVSFEKG
jgi:hypothetical protein